MKHYFTLLCIFFLIFALSGCIYTDVKSPGIVQTGTVFQLTSDDFEILERVSASGETTLWFGFVMTGGAGYQALLEEARKIGGDEVMHYSFDIEQQSVFLFIYNKVKWKATGIAVKLK